MNRRPLLLLLAVFLAAFEAPLQSAPPPGFRLPPRCTQAIVGISETWDGSTVSLQRYERPAPGAPWQAVGRPWSGRLGADGLVWGRGLSPVPPGARQKLEGDRRAPAGVFGLGGACGYAREVVRSPALPYFQVTGRDLWIEDPASPRYNQHVRLDHDPRTPWELRQRMKQADAAHALKLFILHNAPEGAARPLPGAGSSIFFHIWRAGGSRPSSGCTTMPEPALRALIAWVDPRRLPVYILLPRAEYARRRQPWGLP